MTYSIATSGVKTCALPSLSPPHYKILMNLISFAQLAFPPPPISFIKRIYSRLAMLWLVTRRIAITSAEGNALLVAHAPAFMTVRCGIMGCMSRIGAGIFDMSFGAISWVFELGDSKIVKRVRHPSSAHHPTS